jgi:hypothetical protein
MKIMVFLIALTTGLWAGPAPAPEGYLFVMCGSPNAAEDNVTYFSNIVAAGGNPATYHARCLKATGCGSGRESCPKGAASNTCCKHWECRSEFASTVEAAQRRMEIAKKAISPRGYRFAVCAL